LESLIPAGERDRMDAAYAAMAYRSGVGETFHSNTLGYENQFGALVDRGYNAMGLGPGMQGGGWIEVAPGEWWRPEEGLTPQQSYERSQAPIGGSPVINPQDTIARGGVPASFPLNYIRDDGTPAAGLPGYGTARNNASGQHNGIDLEALRGTPVLALEDSVVVTANLGGETTGGGNELFLQSLSDPNRYFTFMHLDTLSVGTGDRVAAGDILGTVGTSGNAPENDPMLHFGVSFGDADSGYVDPLSVYSEAQLAQLLGSSSEVPLAPPQEAGGIILDEVLAPLGEAGPEVVLPLPTMEQIAAKQDVARNEMISVVREEVRRLVDAIFTVKDSVEGLKESDMGVLLGRDR